MWQRASSAIVLLLLVASTAAGQGRGNGAGKGNSAHGTPPSRTGLPTSAVATAHAGTTPFAWVDDATLLAPGTFWFGLSVMRWGNDGGSEIDAPIVDTAIGVSRRVQLAASIPHVVGAADPTGAAGGLGTSYFNAKVALVERGGMAVAAAPSLRILSAGAVQNSSSSRTGFGLPVHIGFDATRSTRVFGGTGYFSGGIWFVGGGVASSVTNRVCVTVSMSRAWTSDQLLPSTRSELSGGASYAFTQAVGVFGSIGKTVGASVDEFAGASVTGGVSLQLRSTGPSSTRLEDHKVESERVK
jgi:hypothetical protein